MSFETIAQSRRSKRSNFTLLHTKAVLPYVAMPIVSKLSIGDTARQDSHIPDAVRMSYRIGRGEQGVLTFEPYKSSLLPHWRFRTAKVAKESSSILWEKFLKYDAVDDFVGMDMTRKFIQMGMTRAKRYANHKGGRKYDAEGKEKAKVGHEGKAEKEEASRIFREVWERCKAHEGYVQKRQQFLEHQKIWAREQALQRKTSDDCTTAMSPEGKTGRQKKAAAAG